MPPPSASRTTPRQRRARERREAWNAEARKHIPPPEDPEMVRWDAAESMWEYDNKPHARRA